MYKLFVGFKKLGEFKTILEAKQFAEKSGYTGVFNLLGESYKDSWYVFQSQQLYITDNKGERLKITDLKAAIKQAEDFASYIPRKGCIYEVETDIYWKDILQKLNKLKE